MFARSNAALNGIESAEYVCGKAEDAITKVLAGLVNVPRDKIVAIVDPPRAGLHTTVVKARLIIK